MFPINRQYCNLKRIVQQYPFNILGEHLKTKNWKLLHQEPPHTNVLYLLSLQRRRKNHLTGAKEKKKWIVAQWSKVLFSDESTFSFLSGGRTERHGLHVAWSPVWSLHLCAGVGPLYFLKSTVHVAICQEHLEQLMLPSTGKLQEDVWGNWLF